MPWSSLHGSPGEWEEVDFERPRSDSRPPGSVGGDPLGLRPRSIPVIASGSSTGGNALMFVT